MPKYPEDDVLAYSIGDFCNAVGVGRAFVYTEISSGRLVARKVGRGRGRTLIRRDDAEQWLAAAPVIRPRNPSAPAT
jgi:excisionase family DNA binding protein